MKCTITIRADNAAFCPRPHDEIARILRECAKSIEDGQNQRRLLDSNGNAVGLMTIRKG